ncbi:MAG: type II secretion system protein GspD, partial [Gammaproteobacteria bacterium]
MPTVLSKTTAKNVFVTVFVAALFGCATTPEPVPGQGLANLPNGADGVSVDDAGQADPRLSKQPLSSAQEVAASLTERAKPVLYRGTDRQINPPPGRKPVRVVGDAVSLNFEQAPLMEVVHAVLGDILGLDYIVDSPVGGAVTLRTATPVPRDELLGVLESLLQGNGAALVRGEGDRFYVTKASGAARLSPTLSSPDNPVAGYSTVIIPLQHISAGNMAEILKPVAPETAFMRVDNARNLLMLAGTQEQLRGWQQMITTFDVDALKGMSVGIFPLENSAVSDMADTLGGLLGSNEKAGGLGLGSLVRIVPIERLNSVLVVTPRAHYLNQVGRWISRLDNAPDSHYEKRLYVYPVQNSSATRLAELLNSIYSGSGSRDGSTAGRDSGFGSDASNSGVAPGMDAETVTDSTGVGSTGGFAGNTANRGSGGQKYELEDVRVVADEDNNALMIYASGKNYRKIASALERLDVVPTQVIIEASIIEVTLTDELEYGLEWTFRAGLGSDYTASGQQSKAASIASNVAGFSYTVLNSTGDIAAMLNALATQSLLNVISTPSVMVLDNQTASIHVGDEVPVQGTQNITNGGVISNSVSYRDTGVELSVRPSVNAGGLVTMDVEQSVT